MIDIPSFAGGKWLHSDWGCSPQDVFDAPSVSVFLVDWEYTGELDPIITPFPWRSKDNRVYFPRRGLGWIYKPELEVALKYFRNNFKFNILESWMFEPAVPIVYPYAFIPDVYRLRQEAILNGDGTEKVYKLGLNSLYGKTAQGKGYNKQSKKKPAYHNLVVAGLTTSRTRAKLLEAAMQSPTDIISLATDGIYSKKPLDLPGVDSQKKVLGQWEFKTHEYMTVIMSGVYWLGNTDMEVEDAYSRGYDKKFKDKLGNEVKFKDLRNHLLKAWHEKQPSYPVPSSRFVTIGSAVGLNDFNQHCWWRTIDRDLDLDMEKVAKSFVKDTTTDRSENLVRAYPKHPYKDTSMSIMSAKYTFEWDDDLDGLPTREFLEEMMYSKE